MRRSSKGILSIILRHKANCIYLIDRIPLWVLANCQQFIKQCQKNINQPFDTKEADQFQIIYMCIVKYSNNKVKNLLEMSRAKKKAGCSCLHYPTLSALMSGKNTVSNNTYFNFQTSQVLLQLKI